MSYAEPAGPGRDFWFTPLTTVALSLCFSFGVREPFIQSFWVCISVSKIQDTGGSKPPKKS